MSIVFPGPLWIHNHICDVCMCLDWMLFYDLCVPTGPVISTIFMSRDCDQYSEFRQYTWYFPWMTETKSLSYTVLLIQCFSFQMVPKQVPKICYFGGLAGWRWRYVQCWWVVYWTVDRRCLTRTANIHFSSVLCLIKEPGHTVSTHRQTFCFITWHLIETVPGIIQVIHHGRIGFRYFARDIYWTESRKIPFETVEIYIRSR